MGRFLNPGNQMFQESLNSRIYVDKSGIIGPLNELVSTREKYVCVSRPRRFGKTMTGDMLVAYYGRGCDSRAQFAGLAASELPSFEKHLNAYDVIHLNIQDFLSESHDMGETLAFITEDAVRELAREYKVAGSGGHGPTHPSESPAFTPTLHQAASAMPEKYQLAGVS